MTRLFKAPAQKFPKDFEEFYSVYPRHEDKLAAFKEWKRAIKLATPEELIEAAKRYAAKGLDKQFTKLPDTWLRKGAWMNEEAQEKPQESPGYHGISDAELRAKAKIMQGDTAFAKSFAQRQAPDVIEEMKRRGYL